MKSGGVNRYSIIYAFTYPLFMAFNNLLILLSRLFFNKGRFHPMVVCHLCRVKASGALIVSLSFILMAILAATALEARLLKTGRGVAVSHFLAATLIGYIFNAAAIFVSLPGGTPLRDYFCADISMYMLSETVFGNDVAVCLFLGLLISAVFVNAVIRRQCSVRFFAANLAIALISTAAVVMFFYR